MKINFDRHVFRNELEGDGDPGLPAEGTGEVGDAPEYFVGEYLADDVVNQLNYTRELPDQLRNLESRVGALVSPIAESLQKLQDTAGQQPSFDPKLEKVKQVLSDYDPKLAEALLPALAEDLRGSLSHTPLSPEMLEPHILPMLQQQYQRSQAEIIPALMDSLPFDPNAVVNRDPNNPDNILPPSTDLQKDFDTWWQQADAATQNALRNLDIGYARAMQSFAKWRAGRLKGKGEAAGDASARLSGARPPRSGGGRQQQPTRRLETEEDGFNSVFAEQK